MFLLVKGADHLIENASGLAGRLKVSKTLIALTVVAMGTSLPELTVNIIASLEKKHDIVLGNIIGSNIANLLLILGVSGVISQIRFDAKTVRSELPVSLFAVLVLFFTVNDSFIFGSAENILSRPEGLILLLFFAAFLIYSFKTSAASSETEDNASAVKGRSTFSLISIIALSMAALLGGGKLTVDAAVAIARNFGMSEKLIALTIISIGTSLPELVTSGMAAYKKQYEIATGNITGSNIFNIFLVLGISSSIGGVKYNSDFNTDIAVLATTSLYVMAALFVGKRYWFGRLKSIPLLAGFITYLTYLIIRN
jgi:cation:H+ antiporter